MHVDQTHLRGVCLPTTDHGLPPTGHLILLGSGGFRHVTFALHPYADGLPGFHQRDMSHLLFMFPVSFQIAPMGVRRDRDTVNVEATRFRN